MPLYQHTLNAAQQRFMARGLTKVMTNFPNTSWVESSVRFEMAIAGDVRVAMDGDDLAEILGNLMENAQRHARSPGRPRARR